MGESDNTLLIKRYASRRLYNTDTSDYVTLEDIAALIREGRDVQIVDLKTGDDLTRQYLLQIIAEHESRGEAVLPLSVLTDLVRSYTSQAQSVVPDFLATSFEMLRSGQSKMIDNISSMTPLAAMPGFDQMRAQQEAFMKAMTGGMGFPGWGTTTSGQPETSAVAQVQPEDTTEMDQIKQQLADMQALLLKMNTPES